MGALDRPMKRAFSFVTLGRLLRELREEGVRISRSDFYRKEEKLELPSPRTLGAWRKYDRETAEKIKDLIKRNYGLIT